MRSFTAVVFGFRFITDSTKTNSDGMKKIPSSVAASMPEMTAVPSMRLAAAPTFMLTETPTETPHRVACVLRYIAEMECRTSDGPPTGREASELIEQLLAAPGADDTDDDAQQDAAPSFLRTDPAAERRQRAAEERQAAEHDRVVRGLPAEVLANELLRRGWKIGEPD